MDLAKTIAEVPQLARGQVWGRSCGRTMKTNSGWCMDFGWPKCCGYTMTIDSPEEQARFDALRKGDGT